MQTFGLPRQITRGAALASRLGGAARSEAAPSPSSSTTALETAGAKPPTSASSSGDTAASLPTGRGGRPGNCSAASPAATIPPGSTQRRAACPPWRMPSRTIWPPGPAGPSEPVRAIDATPASAAGSPARSTPACITGSTSRRARIHQVSGPLIEITVSPPFPFGRNLPTDAFHRDGISREEGVASGFDRKRRNPYCPLR